MERAVSKAAVRLFWQVMGRSTALVGSKFCRFVLIDVNSCRGIFDDPFHGPIIYYHYVNTTIGYANSQERFGWNPLDFSSGWPVVKP